MPVTKHFSVPISSFQIDDPCSFCLLNAIYRNFCSASAVTFVIIGHLNRSFYLLIYLLTCSCHRYG